MHPATGAIGMPPAPADAGIVVDRGRIAGYHVLIRVSFVPI